MSIPRLDALLPRLVRQSACSHKVMLKGLRFRSVTGQVRSPSDGQKQAPPQAHAQAPAPAPANAQAQAHAHAQTHTHKHQHIHNLLSGSCSLFVIFIFGSSAYANLGSRSEPKGTQVAASFLRRLQLLRLLHGSGNNFAAASRLAPKAWRSFTFLLPLFSRSRFRLWGLFSALGWIGLPCDPCLIESL